MRNGAIFVLLALSLALNGVLWLEVRKLGKSNDPQPLSVVINEGRDGSLATVMASIQLHTHKLNLAIKARNRPLAEYYVKGLNQGVERVVRSFPEHQGHRVAEETPAYLDPWLNDLDRKLGSSDWSGARRSFARLLQACNECHAATDHPFLRASSSADHLGQDYQLK